MSVLISPWEESIQVFRGNHWVGSELKVGGVTPLFCSVMLAFYLFVSFIAILSLILPSFMQHEFGVCSPLEGLPFIMLVCIHLLNLCGIVA